LLACIQGNEEITQYLLLKNANVNHKNTKLMTALHIACIKNKYNLVKVLVNFNPELYTKDINGYCSFHYAIKKDLVDIIDYLCKYSGFNFFDKSILCAEGNNLSLAICSESLNVLKHFVGKQSQVQVKNNV